jgi:hypothetical protein
LGGNRKRNKRKEMKGRKELQGRRVRGMRRKVEQGK